MKKIHVETKKRQPTRQFCVKYHPSNAYEPRPLIKPLWEALGAYSSKVIGVRTAVPITKTYRALKESLVDAKARYPDLGLVVLESGRDMFPAI